MKKTPLPYIAAIIMLFVLCTPVLMSITNFHLSGTVTVLNPPQSGDSSRELASDTFTIIKVHENTDSVNSQSSITEDNMSMEPGLTTDKENVIIFISLVGLIGLFIGRKAIPTSA